MKAEDKSREIVGIWEDWDRILCVNCAETNQIISATVFVISGLRTS